MKAEGEMMAELREGVADLLCRGSLPGPSVPCTDGAVSASPPTCLPSLQRALPAKEPIDPRGEGEGGVLYVCVLCACVRLHVCNCVCVRSRTHVCLRAQICIQMSFFKKEIPHQHVLLYAFFLKTVIAHK